MTVSLLLVLLSPPATAEDSPLGFNPHYCLGRDVAWIANDLDVELDEVLEEGGALCLQNRVHGHATPIQRTLRVAVWHGSPAPDTRQWRARRRQLSRAAEKAEPGSLDNVVAAYLAMRCAFAVQDYTSVQSLVEPILAVRPGEREPSIERILLLGRVYGYLTRFDTHQSEHGQRYLSWRRGVNVDQAMRLSAGATREDYLHTAMFFSESEAQYQSFVDRYSDYVVEMGTSSSSE